MHENGLGQLLLSFLGEIIIHGSLKYSLRIFKIGSNYLLLFSSVDFLMIEEWIEIQKEKYRFLIFRIEIRLDFLKT